MFKLLRSGGVWAGLIVIGGLVAVAVWPSATPVEMAVVTSGPMIVTIDGDGRTRVQDRFVVTSPVAGEVLRIELRPGDRVEKGRTRLATLRAAPPVPLDVRSRAEAQAAIASAESAISRLTAEHGRARTTLEAARRELRRAEALAAGGAVSREEVERRQADVDAAADAARAADFSVAQARHERDVATARLAPPPDRGASGDWVVVAPIDGVVLARHHESQSVVPAGAPLLDIGDPTRLEVVADLLSSDAVKIRPGSRVWIDEWGGPETLDGRVRRIEPAGFTKISALGVEEQRVNVIIDVATTSDAARSLGDNYRVEVRVLVWQAESVVKVSAGSVFRLGDQWAVFVVDAGIARVRTVGVGERNGREVRIVSGLTAGERVIVYPPDTLTDGSRVTGRGNDERDVVKDGAQ
jgi:HlyD family secretion protein